MINKILKFFSKDTSSQDEDEAVIARIEETFIHICELFPDKDIHFHLIETYLQVLIGSGMANNPNDENLQTSAYTKTYLLSFIPKNKAGRILGIYMLNEFDPISYQKNLKLKKEFDETMIPLQIKYNT